MSSILLHCGSEQVTRAQVEAVPVPAYTHSWRPVPYGKSIALMHHIAEKRLGLPVVSEQYGLNKKGDQMFGLMTLDTGNPSHGLSIGMRNSYNKTLSNAVAIGAQVFVCDNLCFSGSALKVVRKNTRNVWADFKQLVAAQVGQALGHYDQIQVHIDQLKALPCPKRRGFEMLGVLLGEGLLTPTQATVAYADWTTPRHEEFADRNLWGLYNAVTEGLKKGAPAMTLNRHAAAHDFFVTQLAA